MSEQTAAVGQYARTKNVLDQQQRDRQLDRAQGVGNVLGTVGKVVGQNHAAAEHKAKLKNFFVQNMGGTDAEADGVLATDDPDLYRAYFEQLKETRLAMSTAELMGHGGAGSPPLNAGGIDMTRFGEGEFPVPGVTPALPPQSRISMPGVDTTGEMGSGPQPTPAPQASVGGMPMPSQPMVTDPTAAIFGRLTRKNAGGLGAALKYAPKATSSEDQALAAWRQEQIESSQAERGRPQAWVPTTKDEFMETHPGRAERTPDPDDRVLTAAEAKSMGWPEAWANGTNTFKQAQTEATRLGTGKPVDPKETPAEKEARIKREAKARAEGTNDGGGDPTQNAIRELTRQTMERNASDYTPRAYDDAKRVHDNLLGLKATMEYTARLGTNKGVGPAAYKADLATAKAAMDAAAPKGGPNPALGGTPKVTPEGGEAKIEDDSAFRATLDPASGAEYDGLTPAEKVEYRKLMEGK